MTVLVISTNINELISVCERIVVVGSGCVQDTFVVTDERKNRIRMRYGNYLKDV